MEENNMKKPALNVIFVILALLCFACHKNQLPSEINNMPVTPQLSDQIPFEALGGGKIVFERIGPFSNNYSGVYVVDIENKKSWHFDGVINGPAISPDGKKIAYTTLTPYPSNTVYDVYVMDAAGSSPVRVTDVVGQEGPPSWTSDSKQIIYTGRPFQFTENLICPLYLQSPVSNPPDKEKIIDFGLIKKPYIYDPADAVRISSSGRIAWTSWQGLSTSFKNGLDYKVLVPFNKSSFYSPVWSKDETKIFFLSLVRDSFFVSKSISVLSVSSDGTSLDTLITLSASGSTEWAGANSNALCLSPGGEKILFTRPDGIEVGSHLWLINTDGSGLRQITFEPGITDRSPSWGR